LCNDTGKKYLVGYGEGWPSLTAPSVGAEDRRVSAVQSSGMFLLGTSSSCELLCQRDRADPNARGGRGVLSVMPRGNS